MLKSIQFLDLQLVEQTASELEPHVTMKKSSQQLPKQTSPHDVDSQHPCSISGAQMWYTRDLGRDD